MLQSCQSVPNLYVCVLVLFIPGVDFSTNKKSSTYYSRNISNFGGKRKSWNDGLHSVERLIYTGRNADHANCEYKTLNGG